MERLKFRCRNCMFTSHDPAVLVSHWRGVHEGSDWRACDN